jgi:hypothetical protein
MRISYLVSYLAVAAATVAFTTPALALDGSNTGFTAIFYSDAAITPIAGASFSAVPGDGNFGLDAFGNSWSWGTTLGVSNPPTVPAGNPSWGVPGLGFGNATYGAAAGIPDAAAFSLTFAGDAPIDGTPSPFIGGYNEYTRFEATDPLSGNQVAWTEVFTGPSTVTFFAPAGASLTFGQQFFVNVVFDTPAPIPGAGVAGLAALALAGLYARARRA